MRADELKHYDEDTLVHYGVKGMKWGVRKAERNARLAGRFEAKAASSRSVMDSSQAKLDHYKTRQAKKVSSYNRQKLMEWQKVNDRDTKKTEKWEKHAQARREGRMDPTAKKFAIGMMVAGGLAAAGATYGAATVSEDSAASDEAICRLNWGAQIVGFAPAMSGLVADDNVWLEVPESAVVVAVNSH